MRRDRIETISKNVSKWYEEFPKAEAPFKHTKSDLDVLTLKEEGKKYLNAETAAFHLKQSQSRNSEVMWLKTALTRGTSSDKVAAAVVLIQDNPKYNLAQLVFLISQVKAAKHNQCNMIITALRDLFLSDLLHPKHKLLKFEEQDLDKIDNSNTQDTMNKINASQKKLLAHWFFEDQLHEQYENFVTSLGSIASDTVETNREKAVSVMTDLLIGNAEQEHKLLELIVNKIGDPHCKVGSKAVFCLQKLLYKHPNMKAVVLKEVEKLLFRKNVAQRTQYYAICLLTQFVLNKTDDEIATSLIEVYFAFFKACLKKGEPDSRMMAAILTGVSRAYHFAKVDSDLLRDHIDSVYKVVHLGSFNVSLNALNLLYQVVGTNKDQSDRFYSTVYRKLLDPQIGVANKRAVFLNLMYRVLQTDQSLLRLYAFIKRILQITLYFPANMACAILYVISQILQSRKDLKNFFLHSQKSIKRRNSTSNIKEIDLTSRNEDQAVNVDEDEHAASPEIDSNIMTNIIIDSNVNLQKENNDVKPDINMDIKDIEQKPYDPFCRNPLYASAMKSFHAELIPLSKHFHPSVALFANAIIQEKVINYTGDALQDLTLIRFLDRYVFKNPKKLENKRIQKKSDPLAQRSSYTPKGVRSLPVDSTAYLNETEDHIPVDELFLYRYLKRKNESSFSYNEEDSDNESVNSGEFNEMLDKLNTSKDFDDFDIAANIGTIRNKKDGEDNLDDDKHLDSEDDFNNSIGSDADINEGSISDNSLDDVNYSDIADIEDDDASDMDFSNHSDESDDDLNEAKSNIKNKHIHSTNSIKAKENRKKTLDDIFVSAEKFAQMLEEQSYTKSKHGSTNALSLMDGATSKQIDWETKRNQKLTRSFDRKKRKHTKTVKNKSSKKIKQ